MINFISHTLFFVYNTKNFKVFLSGFFVILACLSLHAKNEKGGVLFCENTVIYGEGHVYVEQKTNPIQNLHKERKRTTKKTDAHVENDVIIEKSANISHDHPLDPFFLFSSYPVSIGDLISIVSQHTVNEYNLTGKATLKKIYSHIKKQGLPVCCPNRRQKLSTAATQYGVLTSFGSQSPPLEHYVIART